MVNQADLTPFDSILVPRLRAVVVSIQAAEDAKVTKLDHH
jgi:hypothetical protein